MLFFLGLGKLCVFILEMKYYFTGLDEENEGVFYLMALCINLI